MSIVKEVIREPSNANRLAERLKLDYTTVRHHLEVLVNNGILVTQGERYNVVYFPSEVLEDNIDIFNEISAKLDSLASGRKRQKVGER